MKPTIAILMACASAFVNAYASTQIALQAYEITLPSPWTYSTGADTPGGSWLTPVSQSSISATVSLGQVLAPGTYHVFLKAIDYDHNGTFSFTLGGANSSTFTWDDRDDNSFWSTNCSVTSIAATNELIIHFFRDTAWTQPLAWMSLYLTSDANETVLRDNRVMVFRYPESSDNDNSEAVPGNRFPNSSFECGFGSFWRAIQTAPARTNSLRSMWSTEEAWHGTHSIKMHCPTGGYSTYLESNPITLVSNKVHTVSVYAKSVGGNQLAGLYIESLYAAPDGFTATYITNTAATVNTATWTRLEVTTTNLPYYPNGQYFIRFMAQEQVGGAIYFDGLQVEEGATSTAWQPKYDFEFDASLSEGTRVFWNGDTAMTTIHAFNNSAGSITRRLDYSVLNWRNQTVLSGSTNVTASAGSVATVTLALPATTNGHFRVALGLTNQNSDVEMTWVVVPEPPTTGLDPDSYFGGLMDAQAWALETMQRLGVKWQCALSPGRLRIEENKTSYSGGYTWPDMTAFTNYGVSVLGVLYALSQPSWLTNITDLTNAPAVPDYLTNALIQYPFITNWQIWNEPAGILPSIAYYTELLRVSARAIKDKNSGVGVVGAGGVSSAEVVTNIIALLGSDTNLVDQYAVHFYPSDSSEPGHENGSADVKTKVIDAYGYEVWNTESGAGGQYGGLIGARSAFRSSGHYAIPFESAKSIYVSFSSGIASQARNFLTCMGYGLTKMFYHDFGYRNIEAGDFVSRQWTGVDYDESLRPIAAQTAGLFSVLDKSIGRGVMNGTNGVTAFAFQRGSASYVSVWSSSNVTLTLAPSVTTGQISVFDVMGNATTPASLAIPVGQMPIIVGKSSLSFSNLCHAFTNAVLASRNDITAPWLQITEFPRVANAGLVSHFRWVAFDDTGVPEVAQPDVIEYRYKLDAGAYSDWSGGTWVNYDQLTGNHLLTVQARDSAGNISTATTPQESTPEVPVPTWNTFGTLTVGTLNLGQ